MFPITESQYFSFLKQEIPSGLSEKTLRDLKLISTVHLVKIENKFYFDFVEMEMFSEKEIEEIKCYGTLVTLKTN